MRPGQLIYKFIFKPTSSLRYYLGHFGIIGWWKMRRGERQMKKIAVQLQVAQLSADPVMEVNYLTGKNYWHQTIICAYSLIKVTEGQVKIKIFSDGTLTGFHYRQFKKLSPQIQFVKLPEVENYLARTLPADQYPVLHQLRNWHPFFQRLIDIHAMPGFSIHLDSDMLFLKRPGQLITAFRNKSAVYMHDQLDKSYFAADEQTLREKLNINCLSKVNGGIVGYDSALVDFNELEQKAKLLLSNFPGAGAAQIEQTLMSHLLFQQNAIALEQKQYAIFYNDDIDTDDDQVVRHYIFKAKLPYFTTEWKQIVP
jgi:hypothetical protein